MPETAPRYRAVLTLTVTNPDGSTVLIVCNSAAAAQRFTVQAPGRRFSYELPASGVVTLVWP